MKHYFKTILLFFFISSMNGQTLQDVLRFSTSDINGTARYTAMGGAFGALGGDFSALTHNPAASSVFEYTQFGVTTNMIRNKNKTNYFGRNYHTNHIDLEFDQAGFAFVLKNTEESPWTKISFAFNYQKTANFDDTFEAEGYNQNGIDNYFLNNAQGFPLDLFTVRQDENVSSLYEYLIGEVGFDAQQGFLGYESLIIDPEPNDPTNTAYVSNVSPEASGYFHESVIRRSGGIKKYVFNFSGTYMNKLNLGININSHKLEYREQDDFYESNYSDQTDFSAFRFNNNLFTFGQGMSFQLGAIAKLKSNIRVGASYESPTWFSITEETTQFIEGNDGIDFAVDPYDVVNIFPKYRFKTPSKYSGSFAYIFGEKGLISVDYTQVNYNTIEFNEPNDDVLNELNTSINQNVNTAGILKVGGEYRVGNFSFRAGYIKQDASLRNFDNSSSTKSIGGGINFGASTLDLSIVSSTINSEKQLFFTGLTDSYELKKNRLSIGLTYTLKL